jgi:hypothetical protein
VPALCDQAAALLGTSRPVVALCDVAALEADLVAVDALARVLMVARRQGCRLRPVGVTPALRELVAFLGLQDALNV